VPQSPTKTFGDKLSASPLHGAFTNIKEINVTTNMSYSVYLTQPLRKEYALIIITTGEDGDNFVSEYFILMKSKDNHISACRHYYHDAQFLKAQFNYDLKLVKEATLHTVQAELDSYLFKKYESDNDNFWIDRRFKPEETENYRLIMFTMHGLFQGGLQFVSRKTICQPLIDYLDKAFKLKQITKLEQS
jgi:hypothetical protein